MFLKGRYACVFKCDTKITRKRFSELRNVLETNKAILNKKGS